MNSNKNKDHYEPWKPAVPGTYDEALAELAKAQLALKEAHEQVAQYKTQFEAVRHKVEFFDRYTQHTEVFYDIDDCADALERGISTDEFLKFLKEEGLLTEDNELNPDHADCDIFQPIQEKVVRSDGSDGTRELLVCDQHGIAELQPRWAAYKARHGL